MDQIRLDPQDKLPPPTPRTHCQQNVLHPQDKKVPRAPPPPPPPPPRILSGTALMWVMTGHCGCWLHGGVFLMQQTQWQEGAQQRGLFQCPGQQWPPAENHQWLQRLAKQLRVEVKWSNRTNWPKERKVHVLRVFHFRTSRWRISLSSQRWERCCTT